MNYENKAILFCEKYGIINYKLVKHVLIYYKSYPLYLKNKPYTVKHIIDFKNNECKSVTLKRYYKKYL